MAANPEFRHNMPAKLLQVMQNLEQQSEPQTLPKAPSVEQLLAQAYNCQSAAKTELANMIANENAGDPSFAYSETERLQLLRDWHSLSFLLSKAVHCTGNPNNYFFTKKQLQNALLVMEQLDGDSRSLERDCYKHLINNYERLAKSVTADGCIVIALIELPERLENLKRTLSVGG